MPHLRSRHFLQRPHLQRRQKSELERRLPRHLRDRALQFVFLIAIRERGRTHRFYFLLSNLYFRAHAVTRWLERLVRPGYFSSVKNRCSNVLTRKSRPASGRPKFGSQKGLRTERTVMH